MEVYGCVCHQVCLCVCVCVCVCMYVCMYARMSVYACVCVCVCISAFVCICVCMYFMYVCTYACMYVCMCVCACAYVGWWVVRCACVCVCVYNIINAWVLNNSNTTPLTSEHVVSNIIMMCLILPSSINIFSVIHFETSSKVFYLYTIIVYRTKINFDKVVENKPLAILQYS